MGTNAAKPNIVISLMLMALGALVTVSSLVFWSPLQTQAVSEIPDSLVLSMMVASTMFALASWVTIRLGIRRTNIPRVDQVKSSLAILVGLAVWYGLVIYLSIVGLVVTGLIYTNNATCIGQVNERCGDINEAGILLIVGLALLNFFLAYRMYKYGNISSPLPSLKFSWRGDRSFPVSFIVFFIFGAIFLGEHLPTIIGFLFNHYNAIDSKPSFFDLGGPGDVGVVFVIYGVFGTLLWFLYRYLSWSIIWLVGATLGGLAEVFLFINETNPAEDVVNVAPIDLLSIDMVLLGGKKCADKLIGRSTSEITSS